jgi:capsular polysaccharide transport system permease protein
MTTPPPPERGRRRFTIPLDWLGGGGRSDEESEGDDVAPVSRADAAKRPSPDPAEMRGGPIEDDGFGPDPFPTASAAAGARQERAGAPPRAVAGGMGGKEGARVAGAPPATDNGDGDRDGSGQDDGQSGGDSGGDGPSARQLRLARRVAARHGIAASSDAEALARLREAGIDPFGRDAILDLVTGAGGASASAGTAVATTPAPGGALAPAAPASAPGRGIFAADLIAMQRDMARRRRHRAALLALRLAFFVGIPTLIGGYYYAQVATPLYSSATEFVIQQADAGAAQGGGGMFSGGGFATAQDSIAVQGYLQSRDALIRLDADEGFRATFSDPAIDPIQRLDPEATTEAAYRVYKRNIRISYDPTEGIVRMEVRAPDPVLAERWSRALIAYAEEQVDDLTQRLRSDQMSGALESYREAEAKMLAAQRHFVDLQERFNVLSGDTEASLVTQRIGELEGKLTEDRLALVQMKANPNPNRARMEPIERRIVAYEAAIAELRARLTSGSDGATSIARIQGELLVAQADMDTRQAMLARALEQVEVARTEANRQVRYLSVAVRPLVADEPSHPRVVANTLVVLGVFAGIYLMAALTAAVLREQVSS